LCGHSNAKSTARSATTEKLSAVCLVLDYIVNGGIGDYTRDSIYLEEPKETFGSSRYIESPLFTLVIYNKHRYATLNLAVLHFHFGHMEDAVQAIQETIRNAQERSDDECLTYSLFWTFQFINSCPPSLSLGYERQQEQLIKRCIERAKELNLLFLLSLSHLALAKYELQYKIGTSPLQNMVNSNNSVQHKVQMNRIGDHLEFYWRSNGKATL
jgi:hypothetical protein